MALYIDGNVLDLRTIKLTNDWYKGTDEVRSLITGAWQEIERKFWSKGVPLVFKTPGIKSGRGKGSQGYSYPRVVMHSTSRGDVKIAWADSTKVVEGQVTYYPISKRVGVNEKTITLWAKDIEEAIFMYLFNTSVVTPLRPTGRTFLVDKEADALKYEETETDAAVISYWLFRRESPFYASDTMVSTLCLAWGINPDNKSITYRKQLLAEAVKKADRKGDAELNLKAFNSVCEKLKDGQDTRDVDVMALIQRCFNNKVIKFDQEKFIWTLLGIDGNVLKTLCKVPPQMAGASRSVLQKHLLRSPDDVHTLESAMSEEPIPSKGDVCQLDAALPQDVTSDYIENKMSWPDKKRIFRFIGQDPQGKKMDEMHPMLIEYFVVNKRTIPFSVIKK